MILQNGQNVSFKALMFRWELEDRGLSLVPEGEMLVVSPSDKLTDGDRDLIQRHRDALLAIVESEAVQ